MYRMSTREISRVLAAFQMDRIPESFDCRHHSLPTLERSYLLVSAPSLEVHPMRHHFHYAREKVSHSIAEAVSSPPSRRIPFFLSALSTFDNSSVFSNETCPEL